MANKTQFAFASSASNFTGGRGRKNKGNNRNNHRRSQSEDTDNTDGAGSLTYSATSSVQSGGSAAGESTDSSFADIMRVLDLQDEKQLKEFIKKEGCTSVDELQKKRGWTTGGTSVASSLAYSTDGESALEGTKLLQTISGQANDSYDFDNGSTIEDEKLDLLFAPAAPAVVKKTKGNKVVLGKDKTAKRNSNQNKSSSSNTNDISNGYGTPEQKTRRRYSPSPSSSNKSTPVKSPPSDPGTPPLPTRKQFTKDGIVMEEDDDVWYKEWWMSCFPDAFKNLMPKR
mmetsp:Transcript_34503/g.81329  ORF Transcript_34503/g.81329 Transcript_34503/m.81329 type:complete len:285 (-) Transcript_34503:1331-2185(-)